MPVVYLFQRYKTKDPKIKYDERTFAGSQIISMFVTAYVCLLPFILAVHSEILSKIVILKGDIFKSQNEAIWIIHSNLFRIMLLFFFRLMTIDMTLFQFIDWFLEQFEEEDLELEDIKKIEHLEEELKTATGIVKLELTKQLNELKSSKKNEAILKTGMSSDV